MGADKINAIMVTYKDPRINDKNPNSFSLGNHIVEPRSSLKDLNSSNGFAFIYKPIPMIRGSISKVTTDVIIHALEALSIKTLRYNIAVEF